MSEAVRIGIRQSHVCHFFKLFQLLPERIRQSLAG